MPYVYVPVELQKDSKKVTTTTAGEEVRLRYDGWLPTGVPPVDHSSDLVRVADLAIPSSPARVALGSALPAQTLRRPSLPTARPPVTITANANVDNLWASWWVGNTLLDLTAMNAATAAPYFSGGRPSLDTWWLGQAAQYNSMNIGTQSRWALGVRMVNSTRLLFVMNGAIGAVTAADFLVEIDGQQMFPRAVDTAIVYDGHKTGLLLTFPDKTAHDVRVYSRAGYINVVADPGATLGPIPTNFVSRRKLVVAGDSWIEGTPQAGAVVSLAAELQAIAPWNVAYLGNGGTGYVNAGPSFASVFGSPARLDAMASTTPDAWLLWGSINDSPALGNVQAAAASAYAGLASRLPSAKGIVVGPQLAGHEDVAAAVKAAALAAPNVIAYIDPVAEGWAAVSGVTGPTDPQHPSVLGAEHLAAVVLDRVQQILVRAGDPAW